MEVTHAQGMNIPRNVISNCPRSPRSRPAHFRPTQVYIAHLALLKSCGKLMSNWYADLLDRRRPPPKSPSNARID